MPLLRAALITGRWRTSPLLLGGLPVLTLRRGRRRAILVRWRRGRTIGALWLLGGTILALALRGRSVWTRRRCSAGCVLLVTALLWLIWLLRLLIAALLRWVLLLIPALGLIWRLLLVPGLTLRCGIPSLVGLIWVA